MKIYLCVFFALFIISTISEFSIAACLQRIINATTVCDGGGEGERRMNEKRLNTKWNYLIHMVW